jgi:hypothetical protein
VRIIFLVYFSSLLSLVTFSSGLAKLHLYECILHVTLFHATKLEDDVELIQEVVEVVPGSFATKMGRKQKLEPPNRVGTSFTPTTFASIDQP